MKTANASIEEIDKSIKGADKEINNAFDELLVIMREETKAASQSITDIANSGHRIIVAVGILTVLLSTLFVWLTSNSITRPLKEAIITAQTVASGDLTSRIEVKSKDETGQLLQALKTSLAEIPIAGLFVKLQNSAQSKRPCVVRQVGVTALAHPCPAALPASLVAVPSRCPCDICLHREVDDGLAQLAIDRLGRCCQHLKQKPPAKSMHWGFL